MFNYFIRRKVVIRDYLRRINGNYTLSSGIKNIFEYQGVNKLVWNIIPVFHHMALTLTLNRY